MSREAAATNRARNNARQIEDADIAQRTRGGLQRLCGPVADLLNGEQRETRERLTLRVRVPFGETPHRRRHQAGLGRRRLEAVGSPSLERPLDGGAVVLAFEQRQQAVAVVREIGMQSHPAAVAAAIGAGDLVPRVRRWRAIDAEVALAAELDGGVAHRDSDPLSLAGSEVPEL